MSELLYLDLKKTALITTGLFFGPLITYAHIIGDLMLLQFLIVTSIILVFGIFTIFFAEVQKYKKEGKS